MKEWFVAITERVKSPFYWAFIFSWSVVNWRVWIILLDYKDCGCNNGLMMCIDDVTSIVTLVWRPLIGVFYYIIAVSFLDLIVSLFKDKFIRGLYLKYVKYGKYSVVSGIELKRKDDKISELEKKYVNSEKEVTKLNKNIKSLENTISLNKKSESEEIELKMKLEEIFENSQWFMLVKEVNSEDDDYGLYIKVNSEVQITHFVKPNHTSYFNIILYKFRDNIFEMVVLENKRGPNDSLKSQYVKYYLTKKGGTMEGQFSILVKDGLSNNEIRNVTLYKQGTSEYLEKKQLIEAKKGSN